MAWLGECSDKYGRHLWVTALLFPLVYGLDESEETNSIFLWASDHVGFSSLWFGFLSINSMINLKIQLAIFKTESYYLILDEQDDGREKVSYQFS